MDIKICRDYLYIYQQRQVIAIHHMDADKDTVTNPDHMPIQHRSVFEHTPESLVMWAQTFGQQTLLFVENNLTNRRYRHSRLKLLGTLRKDTQKNNWESYLEEACAFVNRLNCCSIQRLVSVLKRYPLHKQNQSGHTKPQKITHANIRGHHYYEK